MNKQTCDGSLLAMLVSHDQSVCTSLKENLALLRSCRLESAGTHDGSERSVSIRSVKYHRQHLRADCRDGYELVKVSSHGTIYMCTPPQCPLSDSAN